jgi:uncharacterized protein (TIGR00661 family)
VAHIAFSLSGEGRGHATRVRAVVEALRGRHTFSIFTSGHAYAFLAPLYKDTEVALHRAGGLKFHYSADHRLNFRQTGWDAFRFMRRLPLLVRMIERRLGARPADLVVTDFEPALPRAARRRGIPFLSIDHQHFLTCYDLSCLPRSLRLRATMMAWVVRAYFQGQRETVVSAFFFPPVRRGAKGVTQTGVMLRPEVLAANPSDEGHLVTYWRRFSSDSAMNALRQCGREVRVYGLGARPSSGNLIFREIDEERFVEDLASASALVCTAGNQLVGEALHLGKPVFAMPEPRNFEQYINASFLAQAGGEWCEMDQFDAGRLASFLARLDDHRARIDSRRMNGLPVALRAIERHLPPAPAPAPALSPAPALPAEP